MSLRIRSKAKQFVRHVVGKTGAQTLTHRAAGSAQPAGADNNNADRERCGHGISCAAARGFAPHNGRISNFQEQEATMARKSVGKTKDRGRTHIHADNMTTRPNFRVSQLTQANHPQGRGSTIHRGDRRHMNRVFTNNDRRQPNFSNPAGSGKGQTQGGGKARKGGGKRQKGTYDH
jgi:hypothetical protein